jgi:hypothetical protein
MSGGFLLLPVVLLAGSAGGIVWARASTRPGWRAWLPDLAALGLLALAVLGFCWRVVAGQNWMPADGGDLVSFLYPTYRFAAASLRQGAWPLWNPYLYTGAPHVADIQAGFVYPPNLLLFTLWPDFPYRALQWSSMGHLWWAGAGMYLFLARGCRLRRLAAIGGALAFMFSDAFLVHFGNLNFNAVASWTPWVFWAYLAGLDGAGPDDDARVRSHLRLGWAAVAGVLLALGTLAGHIQATLFIWLALAFYTVAWLYLNREAAWPGRRALWGLAYGALTLAVTVLLAAPVLLPALQLTAYTARATWNYQEAAGYSIAPAQWIGLLMPGFFGRAPQFHWGAWPRVEVGYLGILPLALAVLALAVRREGGEQNERRTWAWVVLAAATFLLALGTYALPHGWLTLLPGFGQLRAPARLVFVTNFSLAVLAAVGLDAALQPLTAGLQTGLLRTRRLVAYVTLIVLGVGAPLAYLATLLVQDRDPDIILRVSVALISVLLCGGLLLATLVWLTARHNNWARPLTLGLLAIALIYLDLGSTGAYQDLGNTDPSQSFRQPAIVGYLRQAQAGPYRIDTRTDIADKWQPDTALLYGLEDVTGLANPLLLADVERYWGGLGSRSSRLYDLLNVRYIVARKDVVLDWEKFELVFDGDPNLNLYQNRRSLPRAFIVPRGQSVAGHETAWQAIQTAGFDPTAVAVVENGQNIAGGGNGQVTDTRLIPNGLAVRVTMDGPGILMLSQVWYPGWRVWVDGVPQGQPLRADYLFQAVPLPAGSHDVVLRFEPSAWVLAWVLAGAAVVLLLVWLVLARKRARAANRTSAMRGSHAD